MAEAGEQKDIVEKMESVKVNLLPRGKNISLMLNNDYNFN